VPTINTKIILGLFTFLLLAVSLAAAQVDVSDTNQLTIGVNYDSLQDDEDQVDFEQTISLVNNGATAENVSISITGYQTADYTFSISKNNFELAAGATDSITITGKATVKNDGGINTNVATLNINGKTHALNLDVAEMVELNKIHVYLEGSEINSIGESGDSTSDLFPGDEIELRFALENLFRDDYDEGDVEGTIALQLDDSDFSEDEIDEEIDFDLNAGDEYSREDGPSYKLTVPVEAEEGNYNLKVIITAKDGNGAEYEFSWDAELNVEQKNDDLRVKELIVNPTEVSCDRKITIASKVVNLGKDDQSHAALILTSSELGLYQKYDLSLDSGSSAQKEFTMDIPSNVATGTYTIVSRAYYDYNTLIDSLDAQVVVKSCTLPKTTTTTTSNASASNTNTATGATIGTTTVTTNTASSGMTTTATNNNAGTQNTASTTANANQISSSIVAESIEPTSHIWTSDDFIIAGMVIGIILTIVVIILLMLILLK